MEKSRLPFEAMELAAEYQKKLQEAHFIWISLVGVFAEIESANKRESDTKSKGGKKRGS